MKKRKIAKAALAVLSIMTIGASGASLAACGKKDDDKHEHSYGSWYIVTEPTLTDDGTIARDCVNNDDKQTNSLPKLTDTSVWTENKGAAVDATHTTDGSRTFDSEYGSVTVTVPKDADAHTYGKWTITKEPTMTAGGKASHTCSATDAHVEEVDIPALSDSKVWTKNTAESVAATHTKDGKDVFDSVYGKVEVTVPASADAHDWGEWTITKNPTLTEGGKASHTCKDTDAFEKEEDIPALSNSEVWTENAEKGVPATCMAEGKRVFESVYGEVEITVPVDADAHDYGAWNFVENKTPTLTEAGKIQRVCGANKDHIQTEDVPALSDADFWAKTVKTAPTHQDAGVANFINATYKIAVTDVVLDKVPHTFGEWTITTKPTMTETGEAKKVCTAEGCAEDESATETKVLPALSDTTVWTAGEEVEADYDHVGSITYTSVYGSVTVKTADKLAAPYDDKIYSAIEIKIDDEGSLNTYVWGTAFLHVGNEGAGEGSGFPFNGSFVFKYTDPATGKITMINTDNGKTSEIEAYVDATTGIIAMPRGSWDDFFIAVPAADETAVAKGDFKISACMGDFIITHGDTTNILVTSNGATFNVTFEDIDGNALVADTCFDITVNTSKTVLIKKDGNVVKGYAYSTDEAKWTVADGLQGTYASGSETIVIDGASGIKIDGTDYNYTVVSNTAESKVIGVIMDGVYFEYALSGDGMSASGGAFVKTEPKVTITYDFGDYEPTNTIAAEIEVSKTVPFVLATPEHASMQFKGWVTVDGTPVELDEDGKYIPMANVTLKAVWAAKVDLHLIGLLEADGSTATIYLGAGDKASEQLTMYTLYQIDEATNTYFAGWFYDEDGDDEYESLLGEDTVFTDEDKGATILAKWVAIPAYVGSYVGSNTYNKNFCNSVSNPIDIAVDGTITGKFTGEVLSYNANTQIMEVKIGSSNTTRYFVYDTASGILLTGDSADKCTNPLSYDMDTFGAKRPTASFGLVVGTTYDTYILDIENKCGTPTILFHNNKIYANVVVTDGSGNVLTAATVKNSKIIVVKDATTNAVILEKASQGADFNTDQHCKNLDGYQGTYANGDDSIVLDGAGGLVKNSTVSGTYTLADEDDGYTIEVYLNSNTEYLHITLNKANGTYSVDKPVVTITFNAGANSTVAADANANINVVYTLPTPTSSGSETFRGWYLDSAFASAVPADWKPTADITIYAKWDAAATVTFHYNDTKNATAHTDTVYSAAYVNDKIGSDNVPAVDFANGADAFVGWFTKDGTDGDWGVAVTGDTVISETVMDVYAQWTAPHALLGSYLGANLDPSESGVAKETDNLTSVAAVDPLGNISGYTSGNIAFVSGNDGPFILGSATHGAADVENGVMFIEWSAQTAPYHDIRFLVKTVNGVSGVSTVNIAWNKGITKLVQIKYSDDSTKTAFIYERNIYGNVSWTAEDASGAAITDHANLTDAATLIITIGADKLTFVRANNDLVLADGYQGAYTLSGDSTKTLKVNGHDTVSGAIEGSYEIAAEGAGYTFDVYSADGKSYYQVTLDKTNMTYTVEKPVVTITFEAGSYATVAADTNANINVVYTLPTPEDTSTHMFAGWFLDSALENAVPENWKPTEDVTLYSKWVTPHVLAGSFKAANLDPSETAIAGGEQSMSSNLTIDAFGKVSGYVNNSTTISSYDSTTGEVVLADGYRGAADATNGVMYIDWQTNKTEPYHDIRFYAKTVNNVYATKAYSVSWDKGCTKLILVTYSDDSTKTVLIYNRAIYGNVTWTAKDGTGAAINEHSKLTNANRIDVTAGTTAFTFVKKDGNFTGLDGFEGTYTMGTTTITVDGGGEIKVGSMPYSYTVVDGKLFFIEGNQMHFLTVDKDAQTCAYVQDGFGGEYTLPDGTTKMTLDGLGKVTGTTKTYVVTGSNIAIYDGETVTKYGIDVDSKVFLGKSIFAGLTFEGNSLKLEFDDDSAISGKLSSTTWPSYEYGFTAEYNKSTNTLTFTITSQNYSMGAIGKTITATVSSGSITFSSSFKYDNSVDVNGKAVTNASFVI